jgi:hypothetical protein
MVAFGLAVLVIAVGNGDGDVFLLVAVLVAVVWLGLRRARRARRPLVARTATVLMLVAWFAWPVAVPLLVAATQPHENLWLVLPPWERDWWVQYVTSPGISVTGKDVLDEIGEAAVYLTGIWFAVSAAALTATWFGVARLVGRALKDVTRYLFDVLYIQSRTLPAMVFLTLFLFVNADMWQASEFLTPGRLAVALLIFAGVAFLATAAQLREERDNLMRQGSTVPDEAGGRLGDGGAATQVPVLPPLTRTQRINIVLAFGARQIAQSVWVGLGVFVFLFALGVTVVPAKTAARWIGDDYQKLSLLPVPVALLHAAVLLAGFAAMYFAVTSMTDPAYRETFFAPTARGLREVLRIHAAYSEMIGASDAGRDARTIVRRVAAQVRRDLHATSEGVRRVPGELRRAVPRRGRASGGDASAGSAEDGESGG